MTCSICKKIGHNKAMCAKVSNASYSHFMGGGALLNLQVKEIQANKVVLKQELEHNQVNKVTFVFDTTCCAKNYSKQSTMGGPSHSTFRTTYATTQSSQPSSICADTELCQDLLKIGFKLEFGRGLGRKKLMQEGPHLFLKVIVLLVNCHLYQVTRDHTDYASFLCCSWSEKILHGPTKLKSASPTNIDIGFKPRDLKWKGKDAVGTS
ncbi:hypothetical protein H5410_012082 [Solanum commersonii]|uniref:Uncharacterized protein n=1 Tax=Solanum commersonii TaxID=4109 RepID=A0A9J6AQD8_SOLCO|nr:hypothetical protein H5410_012082 [Solanum commersonii]